MRLWLQRRARADSRRAESRRGAQTVPSVFVSEAIWSLRCIPSARPCGRARAIGASSGGSVAGAYGGSCSIWAAAAAGVCSSLDVRHAHQGKNGEHVKQPNETISRDAIHYYAMRA
eukprot:2648302-Pleurochrysis_carterae.AAC.2